MPLFVLKQGGKNWNSTKSCIESQRQGQPAKPDLKQGKLDCFLKKKVESGSTSPSIRRKRVGDAPSASTAKKQSVSLKSWKKAVECIEISDDSSSDEYHTLPNTQCTSDEYLTAPNTQTEASTDFAKELNSDSNKNLSEFIISSSPIVQKLKLKQKNNISVVNSSFQDKDNSSLTLDNCQYAKTALTAVNCETLDTEDDVLTDRLLKSEESEDFTCRMKEIKEDISVVASVTNLASVAQTSRNVACQHETFEMTRSAKRFALGPLHTLRYKVIAVCHESHNGCEVKCIDAKNDKQQADVRITLMDSWLETNLESGDTINLILDDGTCKNEADAKVNFKQNAVVVHPDLLISGTTVSNALGCLRRAVLSERFKNTERLDEKNISGVMLVGTIVHSIFQKAIKSGLKPSYERLKSLASTVVFDPCYLKDILCLGTTQDKLFEDVEEYLPQIEIWIKEYKHAKISPARGKTTMRHVVRKVGQSTEEMKRYSANVAMTQVVDIEENIWSPKYGLKGKIDVTGKFKIKNTACNDEFETIMPIEIKTGRNSHSMEHHVQVAIYSLFCDERRNKIQYDVGSIPAGLLLYLKSNTTSCESLKKVDRNGILSLRNQIVHHLHKTIAVDDESSRNKPAMFPHTTTNTRMCETCSQFRNCSLVYKAIDKAYPMFPAPALPLAETMEQITMHLTSDDLSYFEHWMTCVFLESREVIRKSKQMRFWKKSPEQREEAGLCISGLRLAGASVAQGERFLQTFKRRLSENCEKIIFTEGEMVLISGAEPEYIAMATGIISDISKNFVTIDTDRDFQTYSTDMRYSIDRHVWMSQVAVQSSLGNLSILMDDNTESEKLRNLIIKHREPSFKKSLNFIPRSSKDAVATMLRGLNRTQRQAIKRVLLCNDYTLVVGMPGSGKTTTIVAMIRILLLCQLRVLVTSYTHSAVDNLLMKLIKYKVDFLRLGRTSQVHSSVQPFTEQHLSRDFKTPKQLKELYDKARVVGCTCLAVTSHPFFAIPGQTGHIFDVCIVDEASQISQPACLSPLMFASRFVLVGDHQQLPPLVVSQEAKEMGADESLFRRLTRHKAALCELTLQYRMNSDIMGLCNHITYEGRLECAHPTVGEARLKIDLRNIERHENLDEWLYDCLNPAICVRFLDTSKISEAKEDQVESELEASIVVKIAQYLVKGGCSSTDIGIIAPFRKQVELLEDRMPQISVSGVEVNTVDKYQGRDKPVILLSFVKSAQSGMDDKKGELLSDWRRLNVAVTRAKHKLIMVGCVRALLQYSPCSKLLDYLKSKHMVSVLQADQV